MNNPLIYLASRSPRRRELLHQIGVAHEVLAIKIDETPHFEEAPERYVTRMALEKARAGWSQRPDTGGPVLGADTVVVIEGEILGKPQGQHHAAQMLRALAARTHLVISAVALVKGEKEASRLSISHVTFREIGDAEIDAYWQSGEPADKAGGYAVQGIGAVFIERLVGSYSGVMGLPLFETAQIMRDFGLRVV